MEVVAFSSPAEAARHFAVLLGSLEEAVKGLPEGEQHRAGALIHEVAGEFHKLLATKEEHERSTMLARTRDHLTELERLLAGQRQLFATELRERVAARYLLALHEPVTQIFKELFSILDAIADLIEADTMRRLGIKPTPSVPGKPRVKAPKTYKQAQDEILQHLQKAGWTVVGHLKSPTRRPRTGSSASGSSPRQSITRSEVPGARHGTSAPRGACGPRTTVSRTPRSSPRGSKPTQRGRCAGTSARRSRRRSGGPCRRGRSRGPSGLRRDEAAPKP